MKRYYDDTTDADLPRAAGTLTVRAWPYRDGLHGPDGLHNCGDDYCAGCQTPRRADTFRMLADVLRAEERRAHAAGQPLVCVFAMTDAQRRAALGREARRLAGAADEDELTP